MVQNIQEKKNPGPSNHFEQLVAKVIWSSDGDMIRKNQVMWLPVLEAAHYAGNGLVLAEGSHRWVERGPTLIYQDFRDLWGI